MPLRVVIFEDTREACAAALELACAAMGLRPGMGPVLCSESWIARAVPDETDGEPRGG